MIKIILKETGVCNMVIVDNEKFNIDEFFTNYLNSPKIFKDREVLSSGYIPHDLPHRSEQIKAIAEVFVVTLKNSVPSNIFCYGKTGTGKTAVIKYVCEKLQQKCCEAGIMENPKWIFINCNQVRSSYRILATICNSLDPDHEIPPTGLPRDIMVEKMLNLLDQKVGRSICFIVLDEIDCLKDKTSKDNILYLLSRINENLKLCRVNLIGISNVLNFKDDLDPRVRSSLCEEELVFPAYNATQLYDILHSRAELAFYPNVVDDSALRLCGAISAGENGDARRALALLRKAAEIVERRNLTIITDDRIYEAQEQLDHDKTVEYINQLPIQQKMILTAVFINQKFKKGMETNSGELYNTYIELNNHGFGNAKLTSRRVLDLVKELELAGIFRTRVQSFGKKGGRTTIISLAIDDSQIFKSLGTDPRWAEYLELNPSYINRTDINFYDGAKYKTLL